MQHLHLKFNMKKYLVLFLLAFGSCRDASDNIQSTPPNTYFEQPEVRPLVFTGKRKLDLAAIKSRRIVPLTQKFDLNALPQKRYDSIGLNASVYAVQENSFDYHSLPEKDFNLNSLPSFPLKFNTSVLPPPKLIKAGLPRVVNENLFLHEFGEPQGLSGALVSCTYTDIDGFLWIGTDKGLYRYDGETLLSYVNLFAGNMINAMLQDGQGRIWMNVYGGIEVLDVKKGVLEKAVPVPGFQDDNTGQMIIDKEQRVWLTHWDGSVSIINTKTFMAKRFGKPRLLTKEIGAINNDNHNVWSDRSQGLSYKEGTMGIALDHQGKIWIATDGNGVNVIDVKNKKIRHLDKKHGLKSDTVCTLLCDHSGRVWMGLLRGQVNILSSVRDTIQNINAAFTNTAIASLAEDSAGSIWMGTYRNGIVIMDPQKHTAAHLNTKNGLNYNGVPNINPDRQGQVWISAWYKLNMISNNNAIIKHIGKDYISALMEDNQGLVWKSKYTMGFDILDRKNSTIREFGAMQGLGNDTIACNKVINGKVFIGTKRGLDIIDPVRKTITYLGAKQGLSNNANTVAVDRLGLIWIGRWGGGIDVFDPKQNTVQHIGKAQGLNDETVEEILPDDLGNLWISTRNGGINLIDRQSEEVKYLKYAPGMADGPVELLKDNLANIWINTNKGVYAIDQKNRSIVFLPAPWWFNDTPTSLLLYNNSVYVGTNKGVTKITSPAAGIGSPAKWEAKSFGTAYGLVKLSPNNYQSDMISRDGLYWWGDYGITVVDLSRPDTLNPKVYLLGISLLDRPQYFTATPRSGSKGADATLLANKDADHSENDAPENKAYPTPEKSTWDSIRGPYNMPVNLQLPYDQNFIRFQYGSLNLARHDTVMYSYALIGRDKQWSEVTGLTSSINYMNLSPGNYTFEVIGRNLNHTWSRPARFSFTINPPWWQTWWAWLLYIALFVALVYAIVHYRSLQLVKEKRVLEQQVQMRTKEVLKQQEEIEAQRDRLEMEKMRADIAADFHDELGSTLSSIALYSEMAINDNFSDTHRTKSILSLIGDSSRSTVSSMQDMIWTIQPRNDKMQEVIYRICEYAYPLAELKQIDLKITDGDDVSNRLLPMDIRKNVYLVFKEALNNAFKYAGATHITVAIAEGEGLLRMQIKDNGKGFDTAGPRAGNGLSNMRKRAAQAGGELLINSAPGQGTEILFNCPLP